MGSTGERGRGETSSCRRRRDGEEDAHRLSPGPPTSPPATQTEIRFRKVCLARRRIRGGYYDRPEIRAQLVRSLLQSLGLPR